MDLKFKNLIKSFFPKGKFWEYQTNFNYLIDGMSVEFSRAYNKSKKFYEEFNIIESESLANIHAKDYLIIQDLYNNRELQRIIVKYLNQDFRLDEIINDFATFIGINVYYENPHKPFKFGSSKFGTKFGDKDNLGLMEIMIRFDSNITCEKYNKMIWLIKYLKPPYLKVLYSDLPTSSKNRFRFGLSQFGDRFLVSGNCKEIK